VALPDIRRTRAGYVFLAVVLGQILLISAQVSTRTGAHALQAVIVGTFAEVQGAISATVDAVDRAWDGYLWLHGVETENRELTKQLADAELTIAEQRALVNRSHDLETLLGLRDRSSLSTLAVDVIAAGATADFRTLTIDRGTADGVRQDMAVIVPTGVVGRVVVPGEHAAKIQLLLDRNAAAGAIIERSRAQGIVVGGGDDRLRLEYAPAEADIAVGDVVLTSGIDGIFPKGFVIGRVESADRTGGAYRRIVVAPAVDFRRLEDVLVVLTPPPDRRTGGGTSE
jgi:rod shape-determining protein MreC